MKITAVIPARYQSTRFPGKPLVEIAGIPMIVRVYERVKQVPGLDKVITATDDERIYDVIEKNGGEAWMTSEDHRSGTDRIAEVASGLDCDLVVNVQGDEPLIKPEMITKAISPFYEEKDLKMSTLKKKIDDKSEINDPSVVKVVTDKKDNALYFSRSPLPYPGQNENVNLFKHIGLYVFTREFLLKYSTMAAATLERIESLEQLRVLENGYKIKVVETKFNSIGVDKPEDIHKVEQLLEKEGENNA